MAASAKPRSRWAGAFYALGTVTLVIAGLHWAAPLLIPIGIAILLAFLLTPAVRGLERNHIPRVAAVGVSVCLVLVAVSGLSWVVVDQTNDLLDTFPQYEDNLRSKLASLRGDEGTLFSKLREVARKVDKQISGEPVSQAAGSGDEAVKVTVVKHDTQLTLDSLPEIAASGAPAAGGTILAFALLAFILMRREDLRERIFGLVGRGRLPITTRALDEATERITRTLLTQFTVNTTFGVVFGAGLAVIGIPFAPLWGLLAIALRYVPFIGGAISLAMPFLVSVLMMEGWQGPLLVVGWFVILEVLVLGLEAWLIGPGIGVSPAATLVMLAFWTWLWGPIALLLATPLTACLMVMARFLPQLRFLEIALGDRPALKPADRLYQRLLSRDVEESARIAEPIVDAEGFVAACDNLLLPALSSAANDAAGGRITLREHADVVANARAVIELAAQRARSSDRAPQEEVRERPRPLRVLCVARDEADQLGHVMLQKSLDNPDFELHLCSTDLLVSETVELMGRRIADLICIGSMPPAGLLSVKLLCRRLRKRFPKSIILVARWGANSASETDSLRAAGATEVLVSVEAVRLALIACSPPSVASAKDAPPSPAIGDAVANSLARTQSA